MLLKRQAFKKEKTMGKDDKRERGANNQRTRDDALASCKARIAEYLSSKGINPDKPFTCRNPEHQDTRPSMRLDKSRHKAHCFSCGADYDVLDLIGLDYGLKGAALFAKAYAFFGLHVDSDTGRPRREHDTYTNMSITMDTYRQQTHVPADYTAYFAECWHEVSESY